MKSAVERVSPGGLGLGQRTKALRNATSVSRSVRARKDVSVTARDNGRLIEGTLSLAVLLLGTLTSRASEVVRVAPWEFHNSFWMSLHQTLIEDATRKTARAFTGWTIESPRDNPAFYFDERLHDPDPKRVLGKKINAGGIKDAEQVLDLHALLGEHLGRHVAHDLLLVL